MPVTEVAHMHSTDPVDRLTDAHCRLLELWGDQQVRGYARRCAGDQDAADDALQSTYYAMARLKHLAEIENLKAYFFLVLRREIARERGELGAILVEDFARAVEDRQPDARALDESSAGFEDHACVSVQFWYFREQLLADRDKLVASVAGRSPDHDGYRAIVYAAAEAILSAGMKGEPSEGDGNEALRVSYPEYFAESGASANTCHQRLRRARADVRALLKAVAG
jgi:DNA-directed RNA polymerase specialized sigma24 family protein